MSGKKRILIVEDITSLATYFKEILENLGHEVIASVTMGEDAVEICSKERPDLILMDIQLAGKMDGIDAAQIIYERYGYRVIFLTAYSDMDTIELAQRCRPLGYLIKPIAPEELSTAVEVGLMRLHTESVQSKLMAELEEAKAEIIRLKDLLENK